MDVYSVVDDVEYAYVNFLMVREGAVIQSYTLEIKKKLEVTQISTFLKKIIFCRFKI